MKSKLHSVFIALASLAGVHQAAAQGTAFTYQGQLQNNGSPASGNYNLTFSLFNTNASGIAIAGPVTTNGIIVTNGLFTVVIDFGSDAFTGHTNWLQIGVETNGVNTFTNLTPRQQLTPVPYAIYAENANDLSGTLSASQLTSIGNTNVGAFGNFFIGLSGNSTMSGNDNTANGFQALLSDTSGQGNTADGAGALYSDTTGYFNTAMGDEALAANTNGLSNTAIGVAALVVNTSGSGNTAIGVETLAANTNGSFNTVDGYEALYFNTNGSDNIALGYEAGKNIYTGTSNIDIDNAGVVGDNNIIRIGSGQSETFIAGNVALGTSSPTAPLNVASDVVGGLGNPVALIENTDTTTSTGPALRVLAQGSPTYGALTVSTGAPLTSGATTVLLASFGNADQFVSTLDNNGNWLAIGSITANAFISVSDRNVKENFQDISAEDVLNKVAALPLTRWNFKHDKETQHIGPMAQDFQAAFQLSADDKHISLVDEGGVALAAIKGLNQKLQEELNRQDAENAKLKQQNDSLAERLNELEAMVKQLAANK